MTTEQEQRLRELIEELVSVQRLADAGTAWGISRAVAARVAIVSFVREITAKLEVYESATRTAKEVNEK